MKIKASKADIHHSFEKTESNSKLVIYFIANKDFPSQKKKTMKNFSTTNNKFGIPTINLNLP